MCKYGGYVWINFRPKKDHILQLWGECGTIDYDNNVCLCDACEAEKILNMRGPDISTIRERRISE